MNRAILNDFILTSNYVITIIVCTRGSYYIDSQFVRCLLHTFGIRKNFISQRSYILNYVIIARDRKITCNIYNRHD